MTHKLRMRILTAIAIVGLLALAMPLRAHHAFAAEFDENKPVRLQGVVTQMEWINPHAWIHMDVKGPDGKVTNWMIETGAPNTLLRRGWTKNSVPKGIELIIEGYASKDGAARANGRTVLFPDGKSLFAGSSGTGAPEDKAEK